MRKTFVTLFAFCLITSAFNPVSAVIIVPANSAIINPGPAEVKAAIASFRNLPRKERKAKIQEIKKEIKAHKAARKAGRDTDTNTLLLVILAILLPPLAVYLYEGEINNHFWISLILTLLGFLPGIIYALVIILGKH